MADEPKRNFDGKEIRIIERVIPGQKPAAQAVDFVVDDKQFIARNGAYGESLLTNREVRLERQMQASARTAAYERVMGEIEQADIVGTGMTRQLFDKKIDAYQADIYKGMVENGEKDRLRSNFMRNSNITPQTDYEKVQQLSSVFVNRLKTLDGKIAAQEDRNNNVAPLGLETAYRSRIYEQLLENGAPLEERSKEKETRDKARLAERNAESNVGGVHTNFEAKGQREAVEAPAPARRDDSEWVPVLPRAKDGAPEKGKGGLEPTPLEAPYLPPPPAPALEGPSLLPLPKLPGVVPQPDSKEPVPTPDNKSASLDVSNAAAGFALKPLPTPTVAAAAPAKGWSVGISNKA